MRTNGAGGGSTVAEWEGTTSTAVAPDASSSSAIAVAHQDSAATLQQANNGAATTHDPNAPRRLQEATPQVWAERAQLARAAAELRRQRSCPTPPTTDVSGEEARRRAAPSPPRSTS